MKVKIYGCKNCGRAFKVLEGQAVTRCRYCKSVFYVYDNSPKIVVIKPEIEFAKAKRLVLRGFHHRSVAKTVMSKATFEKATLYFIPFFEVRGMKKGWRVAPRFPVNEFGYQAFDYLEKANDLNGVKIGLFDYSAVGESILKANQIPFDAVELRKKGVFLPHRELESFKKEQFQPSADLLEAHFRIVYFPVWEMAYACRGIVFKSYLSAVDGKILRIHALKNHQKKLLLAIGGLFGLATLLSRSFKVAFIMVNTPFIGFSLAILIVFLPLLLFGTALLLPYLWRLFAFREAIVIRGKWTESFPINYTENKLLRYSRFFSEKFTRWFDFKNGSR